MQDLTRRDILKGIGAGGVGLALSAHTGVLRPGAKVLVPTDLEGRRLSDVAAVPSMRDLRLGDGWVVESWQISAPGPYEPLLGWGESSGLVRLTLDAVWLGHS